MGIDGGTLVRTSEGPEPIEELDAGALCVTWFDAAPIVAPMNAVEVGETDVLYRVESWFEGGCRDCTHHKNKGMELMVGPDTQFLLKSGEFIGVQDLQPNMRLRVVGRDCGYESVKSVEKVPLPWSVPLYTMRGAADNFGLGDSHLPNTVLIRS